MLWKTVKKSCKIIMLVYNGVMKRRHMQNGKKIIGRLSALAIAGAFSVIGFTQASAVTYQQEVPVEFTFNPTLSINLSSSSILVNNLAPGSAADSNVVTVSVTTNVANGYILSATAGIKGGNTNLINTSDNTYKFTNLATTAGSASTLNNIPENYWGYTYSTDNGSTWVSGSVGSTAAGYAGLPLDNNDNANERGKGGTTLISTDNPADSKSIQFKIGAKASTSQPAGTYTNVINFYAVTNPEPETPTLQSMTLADCPTASPLDVTDERDDEVYKVQKLADGKCWMLDNLRLDPTTADLTKLQTLSNASATTIAYLKNGGGSSPYPATGVNTTWASSSDNKYDEPKVATTYKDTTTTSYGAGSGKIGVYYNYCAASAGSYCYPSSSSTDDATEDLCPAGWRMPTGSLSGEYRALYTAYSSNTTNFRNAFSTPLSGYFISGSARVQGDYGYFWSSTRSSNNNMMRLSVDDSDVGPVSDNSRSYGFSVRCVLK